MPRYGEKCWLRDKIEKGKSQAPTQIFMQPTTFEACYKSKALCLDAVRKLHKYTPQWHAVALYHITSVMRGKDYLPEQLNCASSSTPRAAQVALRTWHGQIPLAHAWACGGACLCSLIHCVSDSARVF